MKWNTPGESLPVNNEEVLISCYGELHLARYEPASRLFITPFDLIFDPKKNEIQWMKLIGYSPRFKSMQFQ
jgi:hypothetical protein